MPEEPAPEPIHLLLVDGACVFCQGSAQFLFRHDRRKQLAFAPLQGETAAGLWEEGTLKRPPQSLESVVMVRHFRTSPKVLDRSDAVLALATILGGFWRLLRVFCFVPRPIREWAYDFFARHRYRWFGRRSDSCLIPSADEQARFLP